MAAGINTTKATILILLIGEASGVFAGFCPSWFTVASPFFHEQAAKEGNVKRIRAGEIAATAIVMGTGWAVSTGEVGPFALYASAAICAVFIAGYEYQIRNPSKPDDASPEGSANPMNPMNAWDNVT
jgi:hypothetical protein